MKKHQVKQTTERRISASLRIALVLLLLVLNIASVVILTYFLQSHAFIFFALLELIAIGVAVNVGCWSHRRGHIIFDKNLNYTILSHSEVTL